MRKENPTTRGPYSTSSSLLRADFKSRLAGKAGNEICCPVPTYPVTSNPLRSSALWIARSHKKAYYSHVAYIRYLNIPYIRCQAEERCSKKPNEKQGFFGLWSHSSNHETSLWFFLQSNLPFLRDSFSSRKITFIFQLEINTLGWCILLLILVIKIIRNSVKLSGTQLSLLPPQAISPFNEQVLVCLSLLPFSHPHPEHFGNKDSPKTQRSEVLGTHCHSRVNRNQIS